MSKQQNLEFTGVVTDELGNSLFKVELENSNVPEIICTISGKIRKNYIRIMAGDRVKLEMSPYDLTKGRIVLRLPTQIQQKDISNSTNIKKKKKK